jgi:hypothetical protein
LALLDGLAKVDGEVKGFLIRVHESIAAITGLKRATVALTAHVVSGFHVGNDQIPNGRPIGLLGRWLSARRGIVQAIKPVNKVKRLLYLGVDAQGGEDTSELVTDMH